MSEDGFVEFPLRLPEELWKRVEPLAIAASLSVEQMTQAIIVLQFNANGWFKPEKKEDGLV